LRPTLLYVTDVRQFRRGEPVLLNRCYRRSPRSSPSSTARTSTPSLPRAARSSRPSPRAVPLPPPPPLVVPRLPPLPLPLLLPPPRRRRRRRSPMRTWASVSSTKRPTSLRWRCCFFNNGQLCMKKKVTLRTIESTQCYTTIELHTSLLARSCRENGQKQIKNIFFYNEFSSERLLARFRMSVSWRISSRDLACAQLRGYSYAFFLGVLPVDKST